MKKRGFTLVEIIVVIALIAFIGTVSFFGIRLVNKNIKITKLEQITDQALQAARIYLETNSESYNQLYHKKNGVVIPLNVLVNEGLLSLDYTDLKMSDIENEYVMTALSSSTKNGDCTEINEVTSWNSDAPIYLCINQNTGTSSLQTVGASANNISRVTRERYAPGGIEYVRYKYNNTNYDFVLMSVEKDDSLILASENSFGNMFNGVTEPINATTRGVTITHLFSTNCSALHSYFKNEEGEYEYQNPYISEGEALLTANDWGDGDSGDYSNQRLYYGLTIHYYLSAKQKMYLSLTDSSGKDCGNVIGRFNSSSCSSFEQTCYLKYKENKGYKIHLSPCMKITGGTGTSATPYKLTNLCN